MQKHALAFGFEWKQASGDGDARHVLAALNSGPHKCIDGVLCSSLKPLAYGAELLLLPPERMNEPFIAHSFQSVGQKFGLKPAGVILLYLAAKFGNQQTTFGSQRPPIGSQPANLAGLVDLAVGGQDSLSDILELSESRAFDFAENWCQKNCSRKVPTSIFPPLILNYMNGMNHSNRAGYDLGPLDCDKLPQLDEIARLCSRFGSRWLGRRYLLNHFKDEFLEGFVWRLLERMVIDRQSLSEDDIALIDSVCSGQKGKQHQEALGKKLKGRDVRVNLNLVMERIAEGLTKYSEEEEEDAHLGPLPMWTVWIPCPLVEQALPELTAAYDRIPRTPSPRKPTRQPKSLTKRPRLPAGDGPLPRYFSSPQTPGSSTSRREPEAGPSRSPTSTTNNRRQQLSLSPSRDRTPSPSPVRGLQGPTQVRPPGTATAGRRRTLQSPNPDLFFPSSPMPSRSRSQSLNLVTPSNKDKGKKRQLDLDEDNAQDQVEEGPSRKIQRIDLTSDSDESGVFPGVSSGSGRMTAIVVDDDPEDVLMIIEQEGKSNNNSGAGLDSLVIDMTQITRF
ncbi:hypothetical protein DL96DRAFT_1212953 [Flagelloscypha sp. PMI_526]|nr:hypothetical protein DL96DRAFT_1212953 [Flagelloscypha sp. PMI_526]